MPGVSVGGFQPVSGSYGLDRPYQDSIFIRSQFLEDLRIEDRENELKILRMFGRKLGVAKVKPGERYMIPTQSNLAVGDVVDTVTTSGFSFPDAYATDSPTVTNTNTFSRKIGSGASNIAIPLPLQVPNEGQTELFINQYRGAAMLFTKRFVEQALSYVKDPGKAYSKKLRYAINNDAEEYGWLAWLYTGPLTAVVADYGTGANAFTDAIGITNRTNYALTRTLTSINGASNLITPTTDGAPTAGMSNSSNARFSSNSVPFLFGSTASDITLDTLYRVDLQFNRRNVPYDGRGILTNPDGYSAIKFLPHFLEGELYSGADQMKTGKLGGKILNFEVDQTNVIQPATSGSNVIYSIAGVKGNLIYDFVREPDVIVDDRMDKAEMCTIVLGATRYGMVLERTDHAAVIQSRVYT